MDLRVYTSQLLGQDPELVLHGGGNTSVKLRRRTVLGDEVDVLAVKGSGSDLGDIDESGFAQLRLDDVARLADLKVLSDTDMAEQLLVASLVAGGPAPSVEAILHAVLPPRFVDHTHADAVVTLTNTPRAAAVLADVYGDEVVVVPYVMPGFRLARACAARVDDVMRPGVVGMVLMNHGIFTFGDSARESYERMIDLVARAARYLVAHPPHPVAARPGGAAPVATRVQRAELRAAVSAAAGAPMVVSAHVDPPVMAFIGHPDVATLSQQGPATPDHVIRTKPVPLLGRDVDAYATEYRAYFEAHRSRSAMDLQMLDPAPRVILDPELGMCCAGRTAADARIAEDIYRHTIKVILEADAIGGYRPIPLPDLFDMEYWELEQAKLRRRGTPPAFAGEVAVVTGAAGGIGRACADALLAGGAAVVGFDLDPGITASFDGPQWLGVEVDVTDAAAVEGALERTAERFGGLDLLVLNAGAFPPGASIASQDLGAWRRLMAVNVDANVALLREAHPLLRLAPRGGRVVVVGSKNVPAPGPGAAAYSASKAALTQLARVAALEWGADGIRVNVIHPNAVFDTGIWSGGILAERAARYGLTEDEYRTNNVLRTEVTSADVARLCVAMCGPAFAKTTGAQVPVDGGNDRVI
ncbi:MAG: bifunctional aldolase/short-chain dehydrogenase [Actinomycetota bacterium]|nr:bifunctional aldolase/short-chain dehydrogenase [Actinomycetota bacterium]